MIDQDRQCVFSHYLNRVEAKIENLKKNPFSSNEELEKLKTVKLFLTNVLLEKKKDKKRELLS
jgi:archaellum component FlaC